MNTNRCKREGCENPPARGHVYCSKACAPFGHLTAPKTKKSDSCSEQFLRLRDEIKKLATEGYTLIQIADRLNIPYQTAVAYKGKMNLFVERSRKPKGRTENVKLIEGIKLHASRGLTRSQIAARLATSYALVVYYEEKFHIEIAKAYPNKNITP